MKRRTFHPHRQAMTFLRFGKKPEKAEKSEKSSDKSEKAPGPRGLSESPIIILVAGILSLLIAPSMVDANTDRWHTNLKSALQDASRNNRPVFLHIYADWCPNCRRLENKVYPSARVSSVLDHFTRLRINGDTPENRVVADRFSVRGFPTLLVLNQEGSVMARMEGGASPEKLIGFLQSSQQTTGEYERLVKQIRENPNSARAHFDAGIFYSKKGDHAQARDHFLNAWSRGQTDQTLRLDALFNAAVSTMELQEHESAISLWNTYLSLRPTEDRNTIYARLYRGLAYYRTEDFQQARSDLAYAAEKVPDPALRKSAKKILDSL